MLALVAAGLGLSIVPSAYERICPPGVVLRHCRRAAPFAHRVGQHAAGAITLRADSSGSCCARDGPSPASVRANIGGSDDVAEFRVSAWMKLPN
jgi:hypothetical protein